MKIGKLTKSNAQGVKTESQVVLDSADGDLVAIDDSLGPRDDLRHKKLRLPDLAADCAETATTTTT